MTWDDYKPIPGATWNDPTRVAPSEDDPARDRAARLPGPAVRDDAAEALGPVRQSRRSIRSRARTSRGSTQDFWTKPQPVNHGHTIHEYWMEQSRGKIGVEVTAFGPYRMPKKQLQYGGLRPKTCRQAQRRQPRARNRRALAADAGADIRSKFDLVMRMFAGYDESAVWQEFGEMKFQTKGGHHAGVRQSRSDEAALGPDALRRVDELERRVVAVEQLRRSSRAKLGRDPARGLARGVQDRRQLQQPVRRHRTGASAPAHGT